MSEYDTVTPYKGVAYKLMEARFDWISVHLKRSKPVKQEPLQDR